MILYDKNYNNINFDLHGKYFGGNVTDIYKFDNIMLKELFKGSKFEVNTFDVLKSINDDNFINLIDYYYLNKKSKYVDAYTYEYINEFKIDYLEQLDYLFDNINRLEKLFNLFNSYEILTCDIKVQNTIITKNDIVIIDPDFYYITNTRLVDKDNMRNLVFLIRMLVLNEAHKYENIDYKLLSEDLKIDYNKSIAFQLEKKLKNINYYRK